MSAQFPEELWYEGRAIPLCAEPLASYLAKLSGAPKFEPMSTALTRAYVGSWLIEDQRLYLIGLKANLLDGTIADLSTVFSGSEGRIFADWYSGTLRSPSGKLLKYEHNSFRSVYEEDLLIEGQQGIVTDITTKVNGKSNEPGDAQGYVMAAMTTGASPAAKKDELSFLIPDFLK